MFCPECGKKLVDDAKYCTYCGALVQATEFPGAPKKIGRSVAVSMGEGIPVREKWGILVGLLVFGVGAVVGFLGSYTSSIASLQWSFGQNSLISRDAYVQMMMTSYILTNVGGTMMTIGISIASFALFSMSFSKKYETEKWCRLTLIVMATLLLFSHSYMQFKHSFRDWSTLTIVIQLTDAEEGFQPRYACYDREKVAVYRKQSNIALCGKTESHK